MPRAGGSWLRAAAPTWRCSSPAAASPPGPRGRSARRARSAQPCLDYAITNRITHGIWGGLTERERRALRSGWVRASRRERDKAILAAEAAGYTAAAIGRAFGLSRTSVTRVLSRDADRAAIMSRSLPCTVHLRPPPATPERCGDGSRVMAQAGPGETS